MQDQSTAVTGQEPSPPILAVNVAPLNEAAGLRHPKTHADARHAELRGIMRSVETTLGEHNRRPRVVEESLGGAVSATTLLTPMPREALQGSQSNAAAPSEHARVHNVGRSE